MKGNSVTRRGVLWLAASMGVVCFAGPLQAKVRSISVRGDDIVGEYHSMEGARRRTGVIMLNRSDGGIPNGAFARDLASAGYPTLALAYMQDDTGKPIGVPNAVPIPLEYIFRAVEWMKRRPDVDPKRVVLMGVSRGAELALLVASMRNDVAGVIAFSPTDRIWGSPADLHRGYAFDRATWSLNGAPVPFQFNRPDFNAPVREWFAKASPVEAAAIKVENIAGPILLISSKSDGEWPASEYANAIVGRLKGAGFRHRVENLQYNDASHLLMGYGPAITKLPVPGTNYVIDFGGTTEGTLKARNAAWSSTKAFLKTLR